MFRGKDRLLRSFDRLYGNSEPITVVRQGVRYHLNTQDLIQFYHNGYAVDVATVLTKAMLGSTERGLVFWDVGANIGAVSLPLLARIPNLSIEAFEPALGPLKLLQQNVKLNPNLANRLRLNSVALSDEKGEQAFFQSAQPENQGIGSLAQMGDTQPDAIQVTCALGDELIASGLASPPDAIKIDVEGCEVKVLRGLKNTLGKYHPIVVAEHSPYRLQCAGISKHEIRDFMKNLGYRPP